MMCALQDCVHNTSFATFRCVKERAGLSIEDSRAIYDTFLPVGRDHSWRYLSIRKVLGKEMNVAFWFS